MLIMKKNETITIRIPTEIKKGIHKYGIQVSTVVREALQEEIRKKKLEELKKAAERLGELLANVPDEEIVKSIRETRESR